MTGFFSKQEIQSTIQPNKKLSCFSCGLYKGDLTHPKMQPFGQFKKRILNIGEFTSAADDIAGKPFQGREKLIYETFGKFGINLERDCLNINAVMCHAYDKKSGKQRIPVAKEIDCCRIQVLKVIEQYKPEMIFLFGKLAITSVLGHLLDESLDSIEKWRGWIIPDQTMKCWIVPVYAPSYVRIKNAPEVTLVWEKDIEKALSVLSTKMFPVYKEPNIIYLKDLEPLTKITRTKNPYFDIAFDYETTGKKPHTEGHKIVCVSIAIDEDTVYVFEMPKSEKKRQPFVDLLRNKLIRKVAHNMKYEEMWSLNILGTRVRNWVWDTMIAAHILDNRPGITGLKFQTYINFGIAGYDKEVKKWLQGTDDTNANSLNRIEEFMLTQSGKEAIMKYCALDSIFEYRLAMLQKETFSNILPF